jgi:RNA polymerase sigma-70 factor (ECF subfamily)
MIRVNDDICSCSNEELFRAAIAGDKIARHALITKYTGLVRYIVSQRERDHQLIEDVVQDVFLSAFCRLESYQGNAKFGTWLSRIASNTVSNHVRRQKRRKSQSLSELEGSYEPEANDAPETEAIRAEEEALAKAKVAYGLESVAEIYREAIVARYFNDLSYQEIADTHVIPVGTVRSRLFAAHVKLRQALEEVA